VFIVLNFTARAMSGFPY